MNKKYLPIMLTALMLCSCTAEPPAEIETFPDITAVETVSDTTVTVSETETATSAETETETESVTESETETEPETETSAEINSLADLAGDFDSADPMRYTLVAKENLTPADKKSAEDAALKAVRDSEYVRSAEDQAREMFTYENGAYTRLRKCIF